MEMVLMPARRRENVNMGRMEPGPARATPEVRRVLSLAGWPERRMPLVCAPAGVEEAERALEGLSAPAPVLAGLWLYCGRFDRSHAISQELHTPEGSYWHAILHRQEPDDWNSAYWFKRTGSHPVFEELAARAAAAGYAARGAWDPEAFIRFCSAARREGGDRERLAREVQHIEFELLLEWCAGRERMG